MSKESLAGEAKKEALLALREQMQELGGKSISDSLTSKSNNYEDGGIVTSSEEPEGETSVNFDELSKEELIRLLKNK